MHPQLCDVRQGVHRSGQAAGQQVVVQPQVLDGGEAAQAGGDAPFQLIAVRIPETRRHTPPKGSAVRRSASFKGHSRSPMPTPFRPIHSAQITVQRSATATPGVARSTSFRVTEYVQHHQACEVAEILRQTPLQPQAAHSPATISARPRQLSLRALFWARVCESVPALKAGNMPPLESAQERTRPLGLISDASSAMNLTARLAFFFECPCLAQWIGGLQ